jgi:hypothetical protein
MEVFLERLLFELAAIAVQLAVIKLIGWLRRRTQSADPQPRTTVQLAAA